MASNGNPFPAPSGAGGTFANARGGRFQSDMQRQPRYVPNEQEARALIECQRESFWFRALPFGLLSGTGTFMLIQRGILTTKTKLGPVPKVLFAGIFGYMLGKVSYISTCKQKLMKLENSPIADMLRKGVSPGAIAASTQFGRSMENFGPQTGAEDSMYVGSGNNKSDLGGDYSADLDIDTSHSGQDVSVENYDQSSIAGIQKASEEEKRPEMTMTYDQLRKENREKTAKQYREVLPGHFQRNPPQPSDPIPPRAPVGRPSQGSDDEFPLGRSKKMRRNAYGDLISDE